jgi:hypothetical protein
MYSTPYPGSFHHAPPAMSVVERAWIRGC